MEVEQNKGITLFCIRNGSIAMTHAKFPFQLIADKFDFWDVGL